MVTHTHFPTVVAVALSIMMSPFLSPAVLCVGADGHVAFEPNQAGFFGECGNCHELEHDDNDGSPHGVTESKDSCGSCNDYTVSQESRPHTNQVTSLFSLPPQMAARLPIPYSGSMSRSTEPFTSRAPPDMSPVILSHQTVVIIC